MTARFGITVFDQAADNSTENVETTEIQNDRKDGGHMGENILSDDMHMYGKVFSVLGKCTDDYLFVLDIKNNKYVISDSAADAFSFEKTEFSDAFDALKNIVYPQDYPLLAADLHRIISGQSKEHDMEYRWVGRDGKPVWISCRGQVVEDSDGKPAFLVGRISDIGKKCKIDRVTGLYREQSLKEYMQRLLDENCFEGYLLQIGIDNFKEINEKYGNEFGDEILLNLAECIRNIVQEQGRVFRMGGDEMTVLVKGCFNEKKEDPAKDLYREIRKKIDHLISQSGHVTYYTISAGSFYFHKDDRDIEKIIENAGFALHQAKISGKNNCIRYSYAVYEEYVHTLDVQEELRKDIENDFQGFELYYQPVVNIAQKKILGAEALIRWHSSKFGFMSPGQFIPMLEETGLIIPLGRWITRTAIEQCVKWQKAAPGFRINVNLSFVQIKKSNALQDILSLIDTFNVDKSVLMIEVTESGEIESGVAAKVLRSFKEESIPLAIDDFGTGYSNLRYVKDMTFDLVKIDQSFIRNITNSKYDYLVVKQFTELAHSLNLTVCYEGVETEEDFKCVLGLKPDYIQGYYFSKPIPAAEFEEKFLNEPVNL